jgi:hypothetical protein
MVTKELLAMALVLCVTAAVGCASGSAASPGAPAAGAGAGGQPSAAEPDDYACNDSATCNGQMQTCEHVVGGVPPGVDRYSCTELPASCVHDITCACLLTALRPRGANSCTGDGRHLTVRIDVP